MLPQPTYGHGHGRPATGDTGNLADILERVLDRGVVIAGDIRVNLLDIELLTIKLRLVVASVDTAREMGIDWWEHDPFLGGRQRGSVGRGAGPEGPDAAALPEGTGRRTAEER
ncbi:gas vesicle protein [Plantactinospora endophytica]|uniref:gas vesicle protein n=1 Tax=Plantactinospora endophytica TaxID=673535 RepID=UPI001EF395DE